MDKKFMLIDGSSLLYRAFYALPLLTNKNGVNTGAVYGFTNMFFKLIEEEKPSYIVVAFDKSRQTFRNRLYEEYKAHRKPTPPELKEQFPLAMDMLKALGINVIELDEYEADDIIGTLSKKASQENVKSIIVTGDKDAFQLIDKNIDVFMTKKGISEIKVYDEDTLKEEYGLVPLQIIDLKGLMGDASDNIPGIPGVGEKTALKLLKEYGNIEKLLENAEKIKGKLGEKIVANKDIASISKELATIYTKLPIEFNKDEYTISPNKEATDKIFSFLGFRNMESRIKKLFFGDTSDLSEEDVEFKVRTVDSFNLIDDFFSKAKEIYFSSKISGKTPELEIESIEVFDGQEYFSFIVTKDNFSKIRNLFLESQAKKIGCNVKSFYQVILENRYDDIELLEDIAVMAYLADGSTNDYSIENLCVHFISDSNNSPASVKISKLYNRLKQDLKDMELLDLYNNIELPLVKVLAIIEKTGIKVDEQQMNKMSEELFERMEILNTEIMTLAGEEFNVNSPKQLGKILFERLALPVVKKTKTGYSTDAEVLDNLSGLHPIVDLILEYRMLSKLYSTYLEGMKPLIDEKTKRIYSHFQQLVTTTGRLSSTEPNLQNIPVRTELGRKIREFFIPGEGYDYIMSFDYSQVELRVLAHISKDERFIEAFKEGQDIHARTASEVFDVDLKDITAELRTRAKAVNFGIVYGISDYGLARDLGISRTEAGTYIINYFARYSKIKEYMEKTVEKARNQGYITTLFNRRRYLPDINNKNFNRRSFAERTAINTPIQGTAADIIKKAMVDVFAVIKEHKLKSRILVQVHDELVFEVPSNEVELLSKLVREKMQQAAKLDVPLVVDAEKGENWAATKS